MSETPQTDFALLCDLGMLRVPERYIPENQVRSRGSSKSAGEFRGSAPLTATNFQRVIHDLLFPPPERDMMPGETFHVRAWQDPTEGFSRWNALGQIETFLRRQDSVLTGVQGISLVFLKKRNLLPAGYAYSSLGGKGWVGCIVDVNGRAFLPNLHVCGRSNQFYFAGLGTLTRTYYGVKTAFLSFNLVKGAASQPEDDTEEIQFQDFRSEDEKRLSQEAEHEREEEAVFYRDHEPYIDSLDDFLWASFGRRPEVRWRRKR